LGGLQFKTSLGKSYETIISKITRAKQTEGVASMVESLFILQVQSPEFKPQSHPNKIITKNP
jgi:hypothetical protein